MNTWQQILTALVDTLQDHGVKILTGLIIAAGAWLLGGWQARRAWQRREFLDRINVSLNRIDDGTLKIRTLAEHPLLDVLLNRHAVRELQQAARRSTARDPLIRLPGERRGLFLTAVLNAVAEQFADGQLRRDLGVTGVAGTYVLALTFEQDGPVFTRKIRVMVIRQTLLLSLPKEAPRLEVPHHSTRWQTLQSLAASYQADATHFQTIELIL